MVTSGLSVGDKVAWNGRGVCELPVGELCTIREEYNGGYRFISDSGHSCWEEYNSFDPITNKGETTMTNEEQLESTPDYIIITRNTDMFKKGGVFKNYTSFWAPQTGTADTYIVRPYDTDYISPEHGKILLEKKIAVPALQFNPQFVTLEQNEVLQKALTGMKKPAKKNAKKSK